MRSRRAGLSLLEALFGILLSFMVLSAVCVVLQQAVAVGGSLDEQGTLSEVYHAFSLIRRDIANAMEVTQPSGPDQDRVVVSMVDPALPFATRIADNDPFEAGERISVRYFRQDQLLLREVVRGGTVVERFRILFCGSFETALDGTLVWVQVKVPLKRVTKTFQMLCRVRPG